MSILQLRPFMREKRKSPRHEFQYPACIDLANGSQMRNCMIWDISENGARLTIAPPHDLPDEFVLVFRRHCRVVRRSGGQLGVEFDHGS
jgi:PilZ domain